jgi:catechol 2,3-dioxygenase-like lactoylglutathione lyase family enzyme
VEQQAFIANAFRRPRMSETTKPRLVGINHVAIEVSDIDAALEWYGQLFAFTLRGKGERNAFIDMGDQFINMTLAPTPARQETERRHIGLVVDDRSRIIELAKAAGARMVEGQFLDFLDPWGNRLEIIEYANIQFTKAPHVLRGMGLALDKNDKAKRELADKGMADEPGR